MENVLIVQILQHFFYYEQENIIVNNTFELNEIELKSSRNLIEVVTQDITIFSGKVVVNG